MLRSVLVGLSVAVVLGVGLALTGHRQIADLAFAVVFGVVVAGAGVVRERRRAAAR